MNLDEQISQINLLSEENWFTNLPREMTIKILGTLTLTNTVRCKCVCKSWRDLIQGGAFGMSYTPKPCHVFVYHCMRYIVCYEAGASEPLFQIDLPPPHDPYSKHARRVVIDSANGLLLVWKELDDDRSILFLCNPMTSEYVNLLPLPITMCIFGFGVSKLSRELKILCCDQSGSCHLYIAREGMWRSIAAAPCSLGQPLVHPAIFFNGNLHWFANDVEGNRPFVCCFDLETENFSSFSLPRGIDFGFNDGKWEQCVLKDQLCLCNYLSTESIVIWWMKEYGNDNSWVKECVGSYLGCYGDIFTNDDFIFVYFQDRLLINFPINKGVSLETYALFHWFIYKYSNVVVYTPSFLSLKTMGVQDPT